MTTEAELIYTLWDIVKGGQSNQDDPINERLMRQFLKSHRGMLLTKAYKNGRQLPDEIFQNIGDGNLVFGRDVRDTFTSIVVPKIITLANFGFMIDKNGYPISVVTSEEFDTSRKNVFNKHQPKLKYLGGKLTLYLGMNQDCDSEDDHSNSFLNTTVNELKLESALDYVELTGRAVLVNPDDETGYDFTSSPYPLPDALIESMVNSVKARDFNIFLKTKTDEVSDSRENTAGYQTREET